MDRAKVKENPNYVKDFATGAILNTNRGAIAKHDQKMAELSRAKRIDSEINSLKSEVSDIKTMLSKILSAVEGEK